MDTMKKLEILASSAKYDVSCSSSGSKNSGAINGICHSFTQDGRCLSLFKILMTNACIYDCAYCINRKSNDVKRATFSPKEICDLTINFYRRNYIEGLFLSSGVIKNPNYTMEKLYETVFMLRNKYDFKGYIHLKAIPGADSEIIRKAGLLVDRMSVNIELPSEKSLKILAPDKKKENILTPMKLISNEINENKIDILKYKNAPKFSPGGQSTQLIVGASSEKDRDILNLSENLYKKMKLKRVYYSAFVSVNEDKRLPNLKNPPKIRENRLYQADWLMRFYGFNANELLNEDIPNFDLNFDPKTSWALNNIHMFPVEINKADYLMLLRIPGIGMISAKRICMARKIGHLSFDDIKKMGIVIKRARHFITCKGKYYGDNFDKYKIENILKPKIDYNLIENNTLQQLSFLN